MEQTQVFQRKFRLLFNIFLRKPIVFYVEKEVKEMLKINNKGEGENK